MPRETKLTYLSIQLVISNVVNYIVIESYNSIIRRKLNNNIICTGNAKVIIYHSLLEFYNNLNLTH